MRRFISNELSNPNLSFKTKQKYGYKIGETLIGCQFNNENCKLTTKKDFIWYFSYRYGNCFTFNSGFTFNSDEPNEKSPKVKVPIKSTKKPGPHFGLNLEIYSGISRDSVFSAKKYGSILFIHNQTSKPETSSGILLRPGSHSSVTVQKSFNSLTPSPYSECQKLDTYDFDRSLYDKLNEASISYNQQDCLDLCMQQEIIRKCGCYYLEFLQLNNSRPCLSTNEIECANAKYETFTEENTVKLCKHQCPLNCDSLKYILKVSRADFPSKGYGVFLKNNKVVSDHYDFDFPLTDHELKTDVSSVSIYFNDFSFFETTHSRKMTEVDIFATIACTLGLTIGLSLTSVVQVFDMTLAMFKICYKHSQK